MQKVDFEVVVEVFDFGNTISEWFVLRTRTRKTISVQRQKCCRRHRGANSTSKTCKLIFVKAFY